MERHIEIGAVVVHEKSDGKLMTVTGGDETCVKCSWFEARNLKEQWHLPDKLLVVA